jgi:hypothetical protein
MTRPDIKNFNDLNDYLTTLEERIAVLDQEDRTIKGAIIDVNHNLQTNNQPSHLPATGLLIGKLFMRAFSVCRYYFLASFFIGLIF